MCLETEGRTQKRESWSLGFITSRIPVPKRAIPKRAKRPLRGDRLPLVEDTKGWLEKKGPGPLP